MATSLCIVYLQPSTILSSLCIDIWSGGGGVGRGMQPEATNCRGTQIDITNCGEKGSTRTAWTGATSTTPCRALPRYNIE